MRKQGFGRGFILMLAAVLIVNAYTNTASAITAESDNYQVTESEFGVISPTQSCSGQYCAKASIGDMTSGGKSKNVTSTATFGPLTQGEPSLDVIVDPGESNLGILSSSQTASKTTTVSVRSYLSGGYMLQVTGSPPKYKDHTLNTPSTPTASFPGTEQFAINLVENTDPDIGAGPEQIPDNLTSFGTVEPNYETTNRFKYTSGDVVAKSTRESGHTKYTISMIINISNETPAGHFSGDFSAIAIPIF
jgi:hypothetical protein